MTTTMPKRIGALLLAIIMCLSLFPVTAFAEGESPAEETKEVVQQVAEPVQEPAPQPEPAPEPGAGGSRRTGSRRTAGTCS